MTNMGRQDTDSLAVPTTHALDPKSVLHNLWFQFHLWCKLKQDGDFLKKQHCAAFFYVFALKKQVHLDAQLFFIGCGKTAILQLVAMSEGQGALFHIQLLCCGSHVFEAYIVQFPYMNFPSCRGGFF